MASTFAERLKEQFAENRRHLIAHRADRMRAGGRWPKLVSVVASPDFEGKNEAVRQARIWRHMHERLAPGEGAEIEFIFTFTPDELRAADAAKRQTG